MHKRIWVCVHIQLEEDLKCRAEAWEKSHGSPFLMRGQRVMEYISKQWEEHRSQKDKEKTDRVSDLRSHRCRNSCNDFHNKVIKPSLNYRCLRKQTARRLKPQIRELMEQPTAA